MTEILNAMFGLAEDGIPFVRDGVDKDEAKDLAQATNLDAFLLVPKVRERGDGGMKAYIRSEDGSYGRDETRRFVFGNERILKPGLNDGSDYA